jgi:hypothetical protein
LDKVKRHVNCSILLRFLHAKELQRMQSLAEVESVTAFSPPRRATGLPEYVRVDVSILALTWLQTA